MNHSANWAETDVGGLCWISDPAQAYLEAQVTAVSDGHVVAATSDGREFHIDLEAPLKPPSRKQKEPPRRILQRVPLRSANGVENMDNLSALHEASILDNIQLRFRMDLIYTNTGPILIAMNPFKWLPIYGDDVINRFHGRPYGQMPPHCYQEAEDAFVQLEKYRKNQAIVICGESGAGKTETTKLMLHYLAVVSKKTAEREARRKSGGEAPESQQTTIAERMVNSNPLLEAFGNAKTLRNNNSSRFGKFTRFDFGMNSSVICGGHLTNLLLEKVRVVEQGEGERNYHVFYQLTAATKAGKAAVSETALVGPAADCGAHGYTNKSHCVDVDGMDDLEEYGAMIGALEALGVKEAEMASILEIAAAVYWAGDVEFDPKEDDETASEVRRDDASKVALGHAGRLLEVPDATALGEALCVRVRELRGGETVVSNNEPHQAQHLRDALSKAVYARLFDWLVHRANTAFDLSSGKETQFIGVLDIFGFEDMRRNGFEQLFINTTNEQLQKVFNDIIFKSEEEEYQREQIDWDKTAFPDNTPCIDLLTRRPQGILRILDAECLRGNAASDGAKLAAKFNKAHGNHNFYEVCGPASVWRRNTGDRTRDEDFLVQHFAGPIVYTIDNFIDKNRDALFGHVHDILASSKNPIVSDIFPKRTEDASSSSSTAGVVEQQHASSSSSSSSVSKQTVANRYLGQLSALVSVLRESSTRFVRCIKTNQEKMPAKLDKPSVLRQLICSGVMAALEVRRAGFPTRVAYREFVREFRAFTPKGTRTFTDDKDLAAKMMSHPHVQERVPASAYRLGVSKLFLQAEVLYELQSVRNAMLYPFVRRLQRWWIHLQGSILQRKFTRCAADLGEALTEASIKAVGAVAYVIEALEAGNRAKMIAWTGVSASAMGGPGTSAAVDAIAAFRIAADNAKKVVAEAVAQKEEAYRIRATLLSEIDSGTERCSALAGVANSLYDPKDCDKLRSAAAEADRALTACRAELLTVATQWETSTLAVASRQGPHSLRRAGTKMSLSQQSTSDLEAAGMTPEEANAARRKRLDEALVLVRDAETLSVVMLEKKSAMDEARAEFQGSLDLASERLSAIQVDVFIIAGITTVSNAVAAARDAIYAAQKALQAIDPDPVKLAVERATAAVEDALQVAQHEAARVAAMVTLDESDRTLQEISYQAQSAGFADTLKDMVALAEEAINTARQACAYPDVHVLQTSTQRAVDAVNGCGELLEREQARKRAEEKARFNKLLGRFQKMDEANTSVPKFAQKAGASKPLFKVKRVVVADENVSGVGSSSDVVRSDKKTAVPAAAKEPPRQVSTPAPVPPPPPPADLSLDEWIEAKNLSKYGAQIRAIAGDILDLKEITDDDADELVAECAMPKLGARRFKKALLELGADVRP
ncbi:hypothetical protein CTAYLR_001136 [Chrysophaeum taylorii]|uniref:Myosin motor domain-containing protein n=1 Tax=Chrysophaeum taylorii TaxID=2483200 RepID=A0AAD7UP00_9STRA|nr:hypothetical protein CTAYLR_001136 [Chrysophaeum taylorii]